MNQFFSLQTHPSWECSILLLQFELPAVQMSLWVRVVLFAFLKSKVFCFLDLLLYFASAHLKIPC